MAAHFFKGLGETVLGIFKDAENAVFNPQEGQTQSIEVIFSHRHQDVDIYGKDYGAPKPVAWIKTGIAEPKYKDKLCINEVEYLIIDIKPDGLELTRLDLQEP